jgi:ABC-type glycerol-3-phosphate transport system substrate-binding protein
VFVDKYMISKRTKFPDQAFALTRALVSEDTGIKLGIEGTGGMPVRKAHETAPSFQDPRIKQFVDNLQFGKARQVVPQHFEVQPAMSRHVEEAIKGVKPVKQVLKEMDETVLKILKG